MPIVDTQNIATVLKVMFMGDSITVGTTSTSSRGFRNAVMANMVSRIGNKAIVELVGANNNNMCGTSGLKVDEVTAAAYAGSQLTAFKPNVIFLNIGMNDCTQLQTSGIPTLATSRTNLTTLLDLIRATLPRVIVFLTKINDNGTAHTEVVNYNAAITTDTQARQDYLTGFISWIDDYAALGTYATNSALYWADATHPNSDAFVGLMTTARNTAFNSIF